MVYFEYIVTDWPSDRNIPTLLQTIAKEND